MNRLRSSLFVCTLTCIPVLAFTLFSSQSKELTRQRALLQDEISETELRINRLTSENVRTEFPQEMIWNVPSRVDAELSLQKTALDLSSEAELELVAFNVPNASVETGGKRAAFSIEAEGPLDNAFEFLSRLESHKPRIALKSLRIRPSRSRQPQGGEVPVFVQATLWSFWRDEK